MSKILKKAGLIFDANKTKPFLKMSITRLSLLINKKTNHIKIMKKEIARLLADGKEEKARIRVEQLIREDKTVEAYDILELQCELVAERMRFVDSQKEVPPDMDQAIRTLIWAADRSEVSELATVKSQFEKKYGSEYVRMAETNDDGCVNPKVVDRLDCMPPSPYVVTEYLVRIAQEFDVEYTPSVTFQASREKHETASTTEPRAAYEARIPEPPSRDDFRPPPPSGGGDFNDDRGDSGGARMSGGGVSATPAVNAWVVPPEGLPNMGGVPPAGAPAGYHPSVDHGNASRMPRGEYEEHVKGDHPPESKVEVDDPPPPYAPSKSYTHHDIPSPPTNTPSTRTFDIPAAPGYEDAPDDPGPEDPPANPPADAEGGDSFDDLAARFAALRRGS